MFDKLPLSKVNSEQLRKIAGSLFSKFPEGIESSNVSGIVIAGFGEEDIFPSIVSFHIDGITENKLKYKEDICASIDFETSASIVPFAQREMVDTFMEGVDPSYREIQESYLSEIFREYAGIIVDSIYEFSDEEKKKLKEKIAASGQEIVKDLSEKLQEYRIEKNISPVTSVVSMLPKDELAAMAESLVNLTSLKRKFTLERETVGGPIDVAVISKGDGFIWIKRKHYFKSELNPHFFAAYFKEA
ncbi:MAG: hypothetical protein ACE5H1_09240 [Thermodesulfobacteriota bacterium]